MHVQQVKHHQTLCDPVKRSKFTETNALQQCSTETRQHAETAKRICEHAQIDFKTHEKAISAWANRVQDTNNNQFVEAMTSRPYSRNDHVRKVGRWKENLTQEEVELMTPFIQDTAEAFGYELT